MRNKKFFLKGHLSALLLVSLCVFIAQIANAAADTLNVKPKKGRVYIFEIRKEIAKPALRITQEAYKEAMEFKADYILIHMNTYGGALDIADSIRSKILNSKIPVMVFVDNQAISAGALISIAADSIYMRTGASIGAASVVDQKGEILPEKYQSFMRATMRATAEAHGKDTIISGNDTIIKWHRDPHIAEAMVDPQIGVKGVVDSGKVLTLTMQEAIKVGYCEGNAESITEVLKLAGLDNYEVKKYELKALESFNLFLMGPIIQTILILLIIGGIYFELQAPGIGLPLGIAIVGAVFYFFPLYIDGLAENWEILAFIAGIILLAFEIFVIPGFGVAGVSGILLILFSLTMGAIDNAVFEYEGFGALNIVAKVFLRITLTVLIAFILTLWLSRKIGTSSFFKGVALETSHARSEGYIGIDTHQKEMIGKTGIAHTVLRPSGKVKIEEQIFDAKAEIGFIDRGTAVKVIRDEAGQIYVIKA